MFPTPLPPTFSPSMILIMDFVLGSVRRCKVFIAAHPWYTATGALAGSVFIVRKCCRNSMGECNCTTDLTGKTVVITGGHAGVGKATAIELARRNATVIVGCRNSDAGLKAAKEIAATTGNHKVTFKQLDLCSFESVRKFSKSINETVGKLHILINNAGERDSGTKKMITKDGYEHLMQANYLGPFLLTLSLVDLMKKNAPGRIINVSTMFCKYGAPLDVEDLESGSEYNPHRAYNKAKLATVLFTTELSKKLENTGVTVNAVNPGYLRTDVMTSDLFHGFVSRILFFFIGKDPFEGAQTTLHLALAPELEKVSGKFFSDCKEKKLEKVARDQALAHKLFRRSEDLVQINKTN